MKFHFTRKKKTIAFKITEGNISLFLSVFTEEFFFILKEKIQVQIFKVYWVEKENRERYSGFWNHFDSIFKQNYYMRVLNGSLIAHDLRSFWKIATWVMMELNRSLLLSRKCRMNSQVPRFIQLPQATLHFFSSWCQNFMKSLQKFLNESNIKIKV